MSTDAKLDAKFFKRLYELYAEDVRNALQGQHIPEADQEDLVQEVFATAVSKYDPVYNAKAWLLVAAHHAARNWRRRAWHRERPGCPPEPVDERSPEQCAAERELKARVHSVIHDSMDDELRLVFTLVRIEGIPAEQVAQMLDIPCSTVQSMLRRAHTAFIAEGRRRHAGGALLSVFPLLASTAESRWKAGFKAFMKYAGTAVVGAGIALALTHPQAIPLHAERLRLAEARVIAVAMPPADPIPAPSLTDPMPAPPIDTPSPKAIDPESRSLVQPSPADRDETARDELMLIERAKRAKKQRRYAEAMRYLERHREIYPKGKMSALRNQLIGQVKQLTGGQPADS
jgi:RNA polymerase sigma factor (sigma-70 family)